MVLTGMHSAFLVNSMHKPVVRDGQRKEINAVIAEATSGDYYHLMATINANVKEPKKKWE